MYIYVCIYIYMYMHIYKCIYIHLYLCILWNLLHTVIRDEINGCESVAESIGPFAKKYAKYEGGEKQMIEFVALSRSQEAVARIR